MKKTKQTVGEVANRTISLATDGIDAVGNLAEKGVNILKDGDDIEFVDNFLERLEETNEVSSRLEYDLFYLFVYFITLVCIVLSDKILRFFVLSMLFV